MCKTVLPQHDTPLRRGARSLRYVLRSVRAGVLSWKPFERAWVHGASPLVWVQGMTKGTVASTFTQVQCHGMPIVERHESEPCP